MSRSIPNCFLIVAVAVVVFAGVESSYGQRQTPVAAKPAVKPIIFAVLNDGQLLEPIAHVENGKLSEPVNGSDETSLIKIQRFIMPEGFVSANLRWGKRRHRAVNSRCYRMRAKFSSVTTRQQKPNSRVFMALATNACGKGTRRPSPTDLAGEE